MRVQAIRITPAQRERKKKATAVKAAVVAVATGLFEALALLAIMAGIVVGMAILAPADAATVNATPAVVLDVAEASRLPEQRISPYGAAPASRSGTMIGAAVGAAVGALVGRNAGYTSRYAIGAATAALGGAIGDRWDRRHPEGPAVSGWQVILRLDSGATRAVFSPWRPAPGQQVWLVGDDQLIPARGDP